MATSLELIEAFACGLMRGILADEPIAVTPAVNRPAKARRPRRKKADPPAGTTVIPGEMPKPGFDPATEDQPLPGFEGIPRATLREMEAAMDKITRGQGPPPGFYNPEDADTSVPLS